jgi:predicted nucleic acid-binding protein
MRILADTNILARLAQPSHPHYAIALRALAALDGADHEPVIVPQVLYEFWVVCTRPAAENGLGFTCAQAAREILQAQRFFTLLLDERGIYVRWEQLVSTVEARGKSAHDARLVAAMERHGLTHLLTFNVVHFQRYAGIIILDPAQSAFLPP